MSTYQSAQVSRMRLNSLRDIAERIGLSGNYEKDELHSYSERESRFGRMISERMNYLQGVEIGSLTEVEEGKNEWLLKAVSLVDVLQSNENLVLNKLVEKKLNEENNKSLELIQKARTALNNGDLRTLKALGSELKHSVLDLGNIARESHQLLGSVEKTIIKEKTIQSLQNLGYEVNAKTMKKTTLIRGLKGEVSIAAQIGSKGELEIDMAGFDGTTCKNELNRLSAEIEKQGIVLSIKQQINHKRKRGGKLALLAKTELGNTYNPIQSRKVIDAVQRNRQNIIQKRIKLK